MPQMRLGELLLAAGAITTEQLDQGLKLQKETKERLGTVLIEHNIITEQQLIEALQQQLGIEYVDLTKQNIPVELARLVPKNVAKQYTIVPVHQTKDELVLAMADPLNFYAVEEAKNASHRKIIPVVSTKTSIEKAIQALYGNEGASKAIEEMKGNLRNVPSSSDNSREKIEEDGEINAAPVIRLVNSIIERAVTEGASDIHLEPHETDLGVRMRVDGLMRKSMSIPKDLQSQVIARLKVISGMDISERRIPQDGRFNVRVKNKDIDLRVSSLPTNYGEKIVCRLLDKSGGNTTEESIGLTGREKEEFDDIIKCRSGVILIAGPTGSGKSTTMYVMINVLNTEDVNLVTLEDPIEYDINGASQVQINEKTGMTFASGLRAILRQDPDIIAVGEIRDAETADIAMRAAITGHIVLSTIHTNDAVGVIERLSDIGVEPYLISSALRGVISQRLLRRVCPHCKRAYEPDAEEKKLLGIPENQKLTLYKAKGCPECSNTGYKGRIAIFEMLKVDDNIRKLITAGAERSEIEKALYASGFRTLRENAVQKIKDGITTTEELLRVISGENR